MYTGLENINQTETSTLYSSAWVGWGWEQFQPVMKIVDKYTELQTVSKSRDITVLMLQYPSGFRFKLSYVYSRRHALLCTSWCRVAANQSDKSHILQISFHSRLSLRPMIHLSLSASHDASEAQSRSFHIRNTEANQLGKSSNPIIHSRVLQNVTTSFIDSLASSPVTSANISLLSHKNSI
jgi:hypothetical protein